MIHNYQQIVNTWGFAFAEREALNHSTSNLINYNAGVLQVFINTDNRSINIRVPYIALNLVEPLVECLGREWGVTEDKIRITAGVSSTILV